MSGRQLLKPDARSLCPKCCRETPAKVYAEPDGVFMEKQCPQHGPFRAMVEREPSVYRALMNPGRSERPPGVLVIPITHRCNLHCSMCFYPQEQVPDPSLRALRRMVDDFEGPVVVFSGGEPTVRKDLPELITYAVRRGKDTCIATNGLSLEDRSAVARLADAGLKRCLFSMNGLEDRVFEAVEGRPLLGRKLAALDKLARSSVQPVLSVTLVPGVNDGVIDAMGGFLISRADRGEQGGSLRIRTHSAIGRHQAVRGSFAGEVLQEVCRAWRMERRALLEGIQTAPVYRGATQFYVWLLCSADDGRTVLDFRFSEPGLAQRESAADERLPGTPSEHLPARWLNRGTSKRIYRIRLFAWPDATNVDLDEDRQTGIWHIGPGGKAMPFYRAVILNQLRPDWDWG